MLGVQKLVLEKIRQMDRGTIFFIDDFIELGSSGAVRIALMELKKQGIILRPARGIYCYPQIRSEYAGVITPSPETIAEALAKKERVRIVPYGDHAAYRLGLTGLQVSNLKYLTDGATRVINLSSGKNRYAAQIYYILRIMPSLRIAKNEASFCVYVVVLNHIIVCFPC